MSKIYLVKKIDELDNLECETFGENKEEAEKYFNELKQMFSDWQTVKTKDGYEFRKGNKFVEISMVETEV